MAFLELSKLLIHKFDASCSNSAYISVHVIYTELIQLDKTNRLMKCLMTSLQHTGQVNSAFLAV